MFRSARGTQIDEAALRRLLRHTGTEATVHGFRGTFKSWCMETGVSRELAELSLAHTYMGDVEVSYVRTDLLERRRPIMAQWCRFVTATEAPAAVRSAGCGVSAPGAPVLLEHHVCERTGLSPSELDALVRAGVFPKPRRNRNGAHCSWTVDDIEAWRRRNEWVERMRTLFVAENDGMAEIDDSLWRARNPTKYWHASDGHGHAERSMNPKSNCSSGCTVCGYVVTVVTGTSVS